MTKVTQEITADSPTPTYRWISRCTQCGWADDWPVEGMAAARARLHIKETGHPRVLIEDTEAV